MSARSRATVATRVYLPEAAAAAYRLGSLVEGLERAGFETRVLTTRSAGARASSDRVRRWPVLRDRSGAVRGYLQYASFDVPLLLRLLFSSRSDIVVVEPPPTTGLVTRIACALKRQPYAYYAADVLSSAVRGIGMGRFMVGFVTTMERWALRGAAVVLAVSDGVAAEVASLGVPPDRIVVVGFGVDNGVFHPDGPAEHAAAPYFVYGGTMSEVHGAGVFQRAFRLIAPEFPAVRLLMIGGGAEYADLKASAADLGDRVEFRGPQDSTSIASIYRGSVASLASVRPDMGYDFAMPTKLLSSVACGTPVIFSGTGPTSRVVETNDFGWSVPWDEQAVANAMREALLNPRRLDATHVEAVERQYSHRGVADRAVSAIRSALEARGPDARGTEQ